MAAPEMTPEMQHQIEQSHSLVALLAKLYHERSTNDSLTVPITIREEGTDSFVIEVDGHAVSFGA